MTICYPLSHTLLPFVFCFLIPPSLCPSCSGRFHSASTRRHSCNKSRVSKWIQREIIVACNHITSTTHLYLRVNHTIDRLTEWVCPNASVFMAIDGKSTRSIQPSSILQHHTDIQSLDDDKQPIRIRVTLYITSHDLLWNEITRPWISGSPITWEWYKSNPLLNFYRTVPLGITLSDQ